MARFEAAAVGGSRVAPGQKLATGGCTVVGVKYFNARVSAPPDQVQRQNVFLEANEVVGGCEMFFGRYQADPYTCPACKTKSFAPHEKATDVFLAVELLTDAMADSFDRAIGVSQIGTWYHRSLICH